MSKNELMKKIQALSFALLETNLFLDTHVNNKEALDYYYDIKDKLGRLTEEYEENYGKDYAYCAACGKHGDILHCIVEPDHGMKGVMHPV